MLGILGFILVFGLVLASGFAALSACGVHPFRAVSRLWRACSPARRVVLLAALAVLAHFAGAKHDDGGGDDGGGTSTNEPPSRLVGAVRPRSIPSSPPAIVPTTISEAAYGLGLVPVHVGRCETHDFSPSASASVAVEWMDHGAATDHLLRDLGTVGFPWGTNVVRRLTVCAEGVVYPAPGDTGTFFAPFRGELGVVPSANWPQLAEANRPSRVWSDVRADGAFVLTWQNVLLGRDEANPVSFQLQLDPDGTATFRYDLSRLASDDALTNVVSAVAANGCRLDIPLDRSLTSVVFARLTEDDRANPDRDGDGVSTADELLVYGTDPSRCDTDRDGLSDYDELFVWCSDPLDANSRRVDVPDGVAVVLGDLDPFEIPPGSTNTVLEHVFYTGTTNAPFAYPVATDSRALLRVSAQGAGAGRVVVGDVVVPLIAASVASAAPRLLGADPTASDGAGFLVQVVRGQDVQVHVFGSASFSATYESDDFAFGTLPYFGWGGTEGYINFPNTVADIPCIHDLNARKKVVTLPVDETGDLLTCTWQGTESVEIENIPPRSAAITGRFPLRQTRDITYTLSHPSYLFGQTTYRQTVRFCPHPHAGDEDTADDPTWLESGDGAPSDGGAFESPEWWCCFWGRCGGDWDCGCQGRCGLGCGCAGSGTVGEVSAEVCAVHNLPYEQCAPLHWTDFTNAFESVEHLGDVMYIRDPLAYDRCDLVCPYEHRNCCPCPDHSTNYVGLAYKSHRLKVVDSFGRNFTRSGSSCSVWVAGTHPSAAIGDAHLAFAANGEVVRTYDHTVLGVAISAAPYATPLSMYNTLSSGLGVPMTVVTNLNDALQLTLETNVRLPDGNIRLEFLDAEGQFALWVYDYSRNKYEKILDTEGRSVIDLSLARWRKLVGCASEYDSPKTPIYITSSRRGSTTLRFRYWGVIDGFFVQDRAEQTITAINPPLLPDIGNDGRIDDTDVLAYLDGAKFRFWSNDENVKGNYVKEHEEDVEPNAFNLTVDGAYDLVNFFPMAVDLGPILECWGNFVSYRLIRTGWRESTFNYCFADMPWDDTRLMQTSAVHTVEGPLLSATGLATIPRDGGMRLPLANFQPSAPSNRVMVAEAQDADCGMRLEIERDGKVLYAFDVPLDIRYVKDLYSWINMRHTSDEWERRPTRIRPDAGREGRKQFIFLHGANVAEANAEIWGDQIYKRLWHSGVDVDFYNVDWRSNIGLTGANYQENVSNAFVVASNLAPVLAAIPGEKVIMAHSLGNMVVSSMIQDHGLQVSKYLMCNSAVPSEAYDPSPALRVPQLVHPEWEDYPTNTWASCWHSLFDGSPNDDRRLLGWPGRFADVAQYAVNFYSTGDEALELYENNNLWLDTGLIETDWTRPDFAHHCWHKQELFKGRARLSEGLGGTSWAGWGFNTVPYRLSDPPQTLLLPKYSASEAAALSSEQLRNDPVFNPAPSSMTNSVIPLLVRGAILAQGIPALAPPTGGIVLPQWDAETSFNLNSEENNGGVLKPNGWPSRNRYSGRWLHSDMKDVAFYFTYKFYEKVIEKGGLR